MSCTLQYSGKRRILMPTLLLVLHLSLLGRRGLVRRRGLARRRVLAGAGAAGLLLPLRLLLLLGLARWK